MKFDGCETLSTNYRGTLKYASPDCRSYIFRDKVDGDGLFVSTGKPAGDIMDVHGFNTSRQETWTLGMLLYFMVYGRHIIFTDSINFRELMEKHGSTGNCRDRMISERMVDFISEMLCKDPKQRVTLEECRLHQIWDQVYLTWDAFLQQDRSSQ